MLFSVYDREHCVSPEYIMSPDPPGKPGTPECAGTTEDSVTLTWDPPTKDGGKPITGYIVEKREKGAKRWTK